MSTGSSSSMASHIVGYPRMGPKRELKFALESFWDGKSSAEDLKKVSADLRASIWKQMSDVGIKYIPSNTFAYYDQVLDTTAMLGAVPPRYGWSGGEIGFDVYFSMARGNASVPAMEMTKWFDTNYHYIVPELGPEVNFSYSSHKAVEEYKEAKALGVDTVPILVGPVSYLLLSKPAKGVEKSFPLLSLLPKILAVYKEVISELKAAGASWIQFDEPVLVKDLESHQLQAFTEAYAELESTLSGLNVVVETYFADLTPEAYKTLVSLKGVTGFGFDLVRGTNTLDLIKAGFPSGKYLFAGVVDGRNIWANDLAASLALLQGLESIVGKDKLVVSTSCSLLHTAVDLVNETKLDDEIKSWLAFAAQKVVEVNALAKALSGQKDEAFFSANAAALASRKSSPRVNNENVQKLAAGLKGSDHRRATNVSSRLDAQQKKLNLPVLPTTTIGSFPQTVELRRVRREFKANKISEEEYVKAIKEEISKVVKLQEELDIDVLVHGEPERNDMVESTSEEDFDMAFVVGEEEVRCIRYNIASLSRAFKTLLYGSFAESRREKINFTQNGISVQVIRALELYSRKKKVDSLDPPLVLELLSLANMFCCDELKSACDVYLSSLVIDKESALTLMDYGLEEAASLLVAACLQVFLRDLPGSLHDQNVMKYFCTPEAREKLASTGHSSFLLYYFLSQTAIEEDMKSNIMVMLLERLVETAIVSWQKQLAFHLLGCVFYERKEYKDAQNSFEAAAEAGHVYSIAGIARTKYKRGHKYTAYKLMNSLISDNKPSGWMYQERSLYCVGKERLADLEKASELDPTLSFPYKYRAIALLEDNKLGAAISEINKIIGFKVTPDCLELRAWFSIGFEDYEGALRDLRALLTLDPDYMMFHGKLPGEQLVELLRSHVQQWSQADCWMQLYDRWSSVDDIGSLAVVHHMLANDPGKSLLRFRQSLLLLRLNCQKAAMRSLRLARNCSTSDHERLVYEGWILYDTGHREEALAKAEESITIQRSFEAFFLKAYALADSNLDEESSSYVIHLLEEALRCPSDGLRKGQALNNLGSVYVDCEKLDLAADCYMNALNIKHTRAHQGLARVYHVKNQRKAAYDEMTKLIEKARNNASAYEKRSEYCDREMAKRDLTMATQLDPLRTYPYRYRAAVLMDDHKEEEAIAELSKAIFFKPDLQLLHLRAAFHDSMGNNAATLRDCEAALSLDPTHVDTLKLYSEARERISDEQLSRCDSMNRKDAPDIPGTLNYASRAFQ